MKGAKRQMFSTPSFYSIQSGETPRFGSSNQSRGGNKSLKTTPAGKKPSSRSMNNSGKQNDGRRVVKTKINTRRAVSTRLTNKTISTKARRRYNQHNNKPHSSHGANNRLQQEPHSQVRASLWISTATGSPRLLIGNAGSAE